MVNFAVFLFITSETRGRDTIRILAASACLSWCCAIHSANSIKLHHQLFLEQPSVVDLLLQGFMEAFRFFSWKAKLQKQILPGLTT
jgi:hypothetical protein